MFFFSDDDDSALIGWIDDQARWPVCSYSSDFRISDKFICQGDGIPPALEKHGSVHRIKRQHGRERINGQES